MAQQSGLTWIPVVECTFEASHSTSECERMKPAIYDAIQNNDPSKNRQYKDKADPQEILFKLREAGFKVLMVEVGNDDVIDHDQDFSIGWRHSSWKVLGQKCVIYTAHNLQLKCNRE